MSNDKGILNKHIDSNHNPKLAYKFKCKDCVSEYEDNDDLKQHIEKLHKQTEFVCHLCKFTSQNKDKIQEHINYVHEKSSYNEEPETVFIPDTPPTIQKKTLNEFQCHSCSYTATRRDFLQTHMDFEHESERRTPP